MKSPKPWSIPLKILVILGVSVAVCTPARSDPNCESLLEFNSVPELKFYEAYRIVNLQPEKKLEDFEPQTGFFLKRDAEGRVLKNPDGSPVEARLRVLTDNPHDKIYAIGDFNNWGIGLSPEQVARYELKPISGTGYQEGVIPGIKQGQQYRLVLNGKQVLDPAADEFSNGSHLNSVYWDFDRPGAYHMRNPTVDLRREKVNMGEIDLYGLVAKFPRADGKGVGPSAVDKTYAFIADPHTGFMDRFKKTFEYNAVHLLPVNQSVDGVEWQHRYLTYGNFAPDSKFGTPDEFAAAVDAFHSKRIAVIVDYLGSHFPYLGNLKEIGLTQWMKENGQPLFARNATEWGTYRYDYENPYVRKFLTDGVMTLFKRYGIDGIRVDNVGGILSQPGGQEFLKELTSEIRAYRPDAFIDYEDFFGNDRAQSLPAGGMGASARNGSTYFNFIREQAKKSADELDMNGLRAAVRDPWGWNDDAQIPYITNHDESANHTYGATGAYFVSLVDGGGDFHSYGKARVFNAMAMTMGGYSEDTPQLRVLQRGSLNTNPDVEWSRLDDPQVKNFASFFAALSKYTQDERAFSFLDMHPNIENHTDFKNKIMSLLRIDRQTGKKIYTLINFSPNSFEHYQFGVDVDSPLKLKLDSDSAEFGGSNQLENMAHDGTVPVSDQGMHGKSHSVTVPYVAPYSVIILEK